MAETKENDRCFVAIAMNPSDDITLVKELAKMNITGREPAVILMKDAVILDIYGKENVENCISQMERMKSGPEAAKYEKVQFLAEVHRESGAIDIINSEPLNDHFVVYGGEDGDEIDYTGNGMHFAYLDEYYTARALFRRE